MGAFDDIAQRRQQATQGSAFADIANRRSAPVEEPKGVWDSIKDGAQSAYDWVDNESRYIDNQLNGAREAVVNQVNRTVTNTANTLSGWATDVNNKANAYGDELSKQSERALADYENGGTLNYENPTAGYETPEGNRAQAELYDTAVGRPVGYVAMTPFVPAPVRGAAAILAAPTMINDTATIYNENQQSQANGDISGQKWYDTAIAHTAKQALVDPVITPVQELVENPSAFGQNLLDNPLQTWDKVLVPATMVEGAVKGMPKRIKEPVKTKVNNAFADIVERTRPVTENIKGAFDDIKARVTEPTSGYMTETAYSRNGNPVDNIYEAIKGQESGGDYNAVNPDSGATGIIQFMPETWRAEAERYLGNADAEMTPANQELVARSMLDRYYLQFDGDERATIASIYAGEGYGESLHNGKPLFDPNVRLNEAGNLDPNGKYPSVNEYVDSVLSRKGGESNISNYLPRERMENYQPQESVEQFNSEPIEFERPQNTDLNVMRDNTTSIDKNLNILDNPNFNEWFKGSELVNSDGTPKELYHGGGNFRVYDSAKKYAGTESTYSDGNNIYLSTNKKVADTYIPQKTIYEDIPMDTRVFKAEKVGDNSLYYAELDTNGQLTGRGVRAVLTDSDLIPSDKLLIEVPELKSKHNNGFGVHKIFGVDENGLLDTVKYKNIEFKTPNKQIGETLQGNLHEAFKNNSTPTTKLMGSTRSMYANLSNPFIVDAKGNNAVLSWVDSLGRKWGKSGRYLSDRITAVKEIEQYAKENGYDGVILKNVLDIGADVPKDKLGDYIGDTVIVFDNKKIKSTKNRGTFSTSDPNIYKNIVTDHMRTGRLDTDTRSNITSGYGTQERYVSRKEILKNINDLFGANVKTGRLGKAGRDSSGWYRPHTDVIRTRDFGDIGTATHELGHYVDNRYAFSNNPRFTDEFTKEMQRRYGDAYGHNPEILRKEGYAEFFRDYTTNNTAAKRNFPLFYDEFKRALATDKELNGAVNKLATVSHKWYQQAPEERVKGSISFTDTSLLSKAKEILKGDTNENVKSIIDKVYTEVVDELHPLKLVEEQIEQLTGQKIDIENSAFSQAWTQRGWVGKAQHIIEFGDKKYGVKAFTEILKPIQKHQMQDFATYLVALRELDIHKYNEQAILTGAEIIKTASEKEDIIATISKYSRNKKFVKAQMELQRYQNHMLDLLVENGLKTRESVEFMKKKYPHYVPFIRDIADVDLGGFGGGKSFVNVSDPVKKMKGSTRDVVNPLESIIKNTYAFTNAIERNKVGAKFANLAERKGIGNIIEHVEGTPKSIDNTFSVWRNGKKETYATTKEIAKALKHMDEDSSNLIVKMLSVPTKWLRAGATSLSPEFTIRNLARDTVGAMLFSKHGFIPIVDNFKGLALYLKKGDVYQRWLKEGGGQSAMVSLDRNYLAGQLEDILKRPSVVKKAVTNPLSIIQALSEASEISTRLGEFHNATKGYAGLGNRLFSKRRVYKSDRMAALESRDVTLDFGRSGSKTKNINKVVAFFNASIQGTDKLARAFHENPKDMAFKSAMVGLTSYMLYNLNKNDDRYWELPRWVRDTHWIIPTKDTLVRIPKPFEMGVIFGTGTERMLEYFDTGNKKHVSKNAFNGYGGRLVETFLPNLMPTAVLPIIEAGANYSFFTQRSLVPQNQEKIPSKYQYGSNTSSVARAIGGELYDIGLGGESLGKYTNPYAIDNYIRGYTGGLGKLVNDGIDSLTGLSDTRPAKHSSELPFVRGFTATPYASSDSVQQVYDEFNKQEQLRNAIKLTGEKQEGYDNAQYNRLKNATDAFKNVNKSKKAIRDSERLSSEDKRDQLDKLNVTQANIARRALGLTKIER